MNITNSKVFLPVCSTVVRVISNDNPQIRPLVSRLLQGHMSYFLIAFATLVIMRPQQSFNGRFLCGFVEICPLDARGSVNISSEEVIQPL
jgi:hypothetical protein